MSLALLTLCAHPLRAMLTVHLLYPPTHPSIHHHNPHHHRPSGLPERARGTGAEAEPAAAKQCQGPAQDSVEGDLQEGAGVLRKTFEDPRSQCVRACVCACVPFSRA